MDIAAKSEIFWKLDYEGGYDYLVYGNDFKGKDPEFDVLVENYKAAFNALVEFLAVGEQIDPEDGE